MSLKLDCASDVNDTCGSLSREDSGGEDGSRFSMWSIEFPIGRVKQSRGRGHKASAFSKGQAGRQFIILCKPRILFTATATQLVQSTSRTLSLPFTRLSRLTDFVSDNPTQHPSSPGTQPWHTLSMANYSNQPRNSSSNYYQATKEVAARSNIQASAYTVDAVDMALKGFHYSTCGAGGTYSASEHIIRQTKTMTGAGWWV